MNRRQGKHLYPYLKLHQFPKPVHCSTPESRSTTAIEETHGLSQLQSYIINPPIPTANKPATAHLPVAAGAAPVAAAVASSEALCTVEDGVSLAVGSSVDMSVVELGMEVADSLSGSVPVVEAESWLSSVVGLGLVLMEPAVMELADMADMADDMED